MFNITLVNKITAIVSDSVKIEKVFGVWGSIYRFMTWWHELFLTRNPQSEPRGLEKILKKNKLWLIFFFKTELHILIF